ncbi:MAG TPA: TIGR03790 family protein [Tepidisphaeraceae bacterium]|jgi:uncharacterized protein (TIGR03790 family)|nr:TIGR03790 family protein [Tepidisphaeraceae bacterium]
MTHICRSAFFLFLLLITPAFALTPDQLLLIVNHNSPGGRKLAEHYAAARHVPDNRIVELSLPTGDDVTFDQYERDVVPPVRRFLTENHLENKVTCLVTFYGIPLRVARRVAEPTDAKELVDLQADISNTRPKIESFVIDFEKLATQLDPSFNAHLTGGGIEDLVQRAERARQTIERQIPKLIDPAARNAAFQSMLKLAEPLIGANTLGLSLAERAISSSGVSQADHDKWSKVIAFAKQSQQRLHDLEIIRYDSFARAKARDLAQKQFGLLEYANLVQGQLAYLKPGDTASALDNELSLLWWDLYPRAAWEANPLYYSFPHIAHPPVMMTARMDAPTLVIADRMLADSLRTEQTGLAGRVVIDARGIASGRDAYARFDRHLMNLAEILKAHPSPIFSLFLDVKPEVLPPNSVENVALYAGWYSVGHYIPSCKFVPGAVAYHIASYELGSLHNPGGAWVPHLLQDGVAASLGPVAEPYLTSFPLPDEFLPLLMTGKVTLAEAYWRTNPMTSWMIALVGDPLYNPFAKAPALQVEDLPTALQSATQAPMTVNPTTQP